ncbi:serine/threonine-protein kinase [Nannocystaceae bacterium ST9]
MGALERVDPPRSLGDMTLLATLGEGGMATVYLAGVGEGPLARICAVKLLRAGLPDHDYRTRFLDEARLVVRLHHNNIVDVRNAGEIDGQFYIAMEAIEGRDLADVWDRCAEVGRAFPVPLAVHVCREVLRGLHYAHTFPGLGLVHRDVSPSNILLDWAGAVRLADFGLATSSLKASLTLPGVVFGKVGYMSPEQARHEPLDGRADVYAVAVVLWELLTGRPLRSPDGMSTDTVSRFEAPAPSARSKRVDPHLDKIVIKGLARNRDERWASAEAMMLALNGWLADNAPDMGQEKVSEFMRKLFGNARELESALRVDLLRELAASQRAASGTQILEESRRLRAASGKSDAAEDDHQSRGSARANPVATTLDERELIEPGTVIADRYRVLSRLGRGGMGYVYLGEHVTVGRSVAIKVLTFDWSRSNAVAQRFRAEARAASAAGHPNIIEVFDAGELPDGRLYLVMEFLTGRNLYEEVQVNGRMPVPRACHVMRDVGRAIRAAHEVGIIHRDLKPDNVMLVERGYNEGELVKVLDFGISASAQRNEDEKRLTVVGQALGTPEYMAPEQAKGRDANEGFDIYAMGVMFFELLTGDPPFHGLNVLEIVTRKTSEPAPSVGSLRGDLPRDLIKLVDDCLAIDPANRPRTAQIFLARLEDVLRALPRTATGSNQTIAFEASLTRGEKPDDTLDEPNPPGDSLARGRAGDSLTDEPAATTQVIRPQARAAWPWLVAAAIVVLVVFFSTQAINDARDGARGEGNANEEAGATKTDEGEPIAEGEPTPGEGTSTTTGALEPDGGESTSSTTSTTTGETGSESETGAAEATDDGGSAKTAPPHTTVACAKVRADAEVAERAFNGNEVLRLTRANKKCWAKASERTALEVSALFELGKFADCAKVGKNHPNAKAKKTAETCQKRVDEG